MKLTKNLGNIASILCTVYLIKKNLYPKVHIDMTPLSSLHTTKFDACDIMMSISTDWASFFGCIFWILNHKTMKLSRQLTFPRTIFLGNTLNALVDWCLVPGPLWFTYLLQFFNNQLPMIYSFSLNWKDALRQLKKHI